MKDWYTASGLSASSAEDDRGYRNALGVVELRRDAGAVDGGSGESGVGVSELVACCDILGTVYLCALPLGSIHRRIIVELLPPNSHIVVVDGNIGENSVLSGGGKSIIVRLFVCSGSNAEEAVLRVDSVKSSVLARLEQAISSPTVQTL